ncbi:MAG: hydrogenase maturation nickel metallochaperone HypA [Clostridia bacterium]|nr:hydrogenase maturation nickel metallochaperone HypA [Candidatus Limimonas egerieequi]MCQ2489375.1 hydrogenase maturation nickel metallochaperone HypA [Clostridia bacterium]
MHELGVVFTVIDKIEDVAKENELTCVKTVTLELGEVSAVLPELLIDCWKWAVPKHEIMKEAELKIETLPAVTFCSDCKKTYSTVAHGKTCPYCSGGNTYLIQGNEFNIKEIEAL